MPQRKQLHFAPASKEDAAALAALHSSVAEALTAKHGKGPWSMLTTEKGSLFAMRNRRVIVARIGGEIVATFELATKKPWAIDVAYFSPCKKPLYLLSMAVAPALQRKGIGRLCIGEAIKLAKELPADFIRLDAFDAEAGAGEFYKKCGFAERGRTSYRNAPLVYFEMKLGANAGES